MTMWPLEMIMEIIIEARFLIKITINIISIYLGGGKGGISFLLERTIDEPPLAMVT